jgi:hypothetical protein
MKFKLALVSTVAAAALSLGAAAQEWELVALDSGQLTFVDGARVQRNQVAASVWALESFAEVHYIGEHSDPYRSRSLRYVINCSEDTYAIAESVMHEGELGHGATVWSGRTQVPTFVRTSVGEHEAALLAAACQGTALAQDKISGPIAN